MSVDAISSSSAVPPLRPFQQQRDYFSQLQQSLSAGDLTGAQQAFTSLQQLISAIFPGGNPKTYDSYGRLPVNSLPQLSIYERVC